MIDQNTIEDVRLKADIVDIVSKYVPLKQKGKNFLGLCPFHQEKTPSFTVSPAKQIFHCFGCHQGGNVFSFIMEMEKINFVEAVKVIGEIVGIEVKDSFEDNEQVQAIKKEKDVLYQINEKAKNFYKEKNIGNEIQEYLKSRDHGVDFTAIIWLLFIIMNSTYIISEFYNEKYLQELEKRKKNNN